MENLLSAYEFAHPFSCAEGQLWATNREVQASACKTAALFTKYMRVTSKRNIGVYESKKIALFSPISKLMTYGGPARIPATMACCEMIRYDSKSLSKLIERASCITGLCNVLDECIQKGQNGLLMCEIMMALQSILENQPSFEEDVIVSIGLSLAQVYVSAAHE